MNYSFLETAFLTNKKEAREFLKSYLNFKSVFYLILFVIISLVFLFFFEPINYNINNINGMNIAIFLLCFSLLVQKPHKYFKNDFILYDWIVLFKTFIINSNEYAQQLKFLEQNLSNQKDEYNISLLKNYNIPKIIIIVGESTQRNYMSLYGYPLDTTPKLKQHQLNGNLYVFNDIISPHSHTNTSIAKIFTFSNYENEEIHWYKQKNIIDIMKRVGYYTYWISNQESISSFGNAPEAIARRADYTIFLDRMFTGNSITKDEILVDELHRITSKKEKELYILHLLGTHMDYSQRYPHKKFKYFTVEDLKKYNLNFLKNGEQLNNKQMLLKMHYLNAILYNDHVVSKIFNYFKDENAIIFYFSDHGEEVYDFRNFFGHAETMASRYMVEIPFMIYLSNKFKNTYPSIIQKISSSTSKPFMTDDFIHAFLDLLGIDIDEFQKQRSIFNDVYNNNRVRFFANKDYDKYFK